MTPDRRSVPVGEARIPSGLPPAIPGRGPDDPFPAWVGNPSQRVHLVCFDPHEEEAFRARIRIEVQREVPGWRFPLCEGSLDGCQVGLLRLPFGDKPQRLRETFQAFLELARPNLVVVAGTCLTCRPHLTNGTMVMPGEVISEAGRRSLQHPFVREAEAAMPHGQTLVRVTSLTTATFVDSDEHRGRLQARHPDAEIIEMEDAHLAELAAGAGVSLVILRGVTDSGSFAEHMDNLPGVVPRVVSLVRRFLRVLRQQRDLRLLENPTTAHLAYRILVRSIGRGLSIPQAVTWAGRLLDWFGVTRFLPRGSRVDLVVRTSVEEEPLPRTPTGMGVVKTHPGHWSLVFDGAAGFVRIAVSERWLRRPGEPPANLPHLLLKATPEPCATIGEEPARGTFAMPAVFHIQGLNSVSAEPEEGLLAATTIEEFRQNGLTVGRSGEAGVWIYRTANAEGTSYFQPSYPLPMRDPGDLPADRCLIATGLGPAIDPTAAGGADAWAMILGDEQGGRLVQYLEDLAAGPFTAEVVFRYEGVAQRLDEESVALSRLDHRYILSPQGFDSLSFDPLTLRQIYSSQYDEFFRAYFGRPRRLTRPKTSFLLLTSRGCGNRCSICCSGGYQPFTALSPARVVEILDRIREVSHLGNGEYLDVYLLDSYFNRDPQRIIELAALVEREGLRRWFEFHVRHNGLLGFLRRGPGGPLVHTELIRAFRKLGIDEVVMGIDAYTEASIRMLKTDIEHLAVAGESGRAAYGIAQIEEVLVAIEQEGLRSRGFLLLENPFLGEEDRLETFYQLLRLALRVRRFRIDFDSSHRVNELKPFLGAPITRLAERVPGLIVGDRFQPPPGGNGLAEILNFGLFNRTRSEPGALPHFFAEVQVLRLRLSMHVAGRMRGFACLPRQEQIEALRLVQRFLACEGGLEKSALPFLTRHPDLRSLEGQIRWRAQGIQRLLHAIEVPGLALEGEDPRRFFALLREGRRPMEGDPPHG